MRNKNLIHELIPAEKRLARIDRIDRELERRFAAKEISLTEYVETKQPLTVRRFKEFRLIEKARGWDRPDVDIPTPVEAPPEFQEVIEPVNIGQRLIGFGVVLLVIVLGSWLWCYLNKS